MNVIGKQVPWTGEWYCIGGTPTEENKYDDIDQNFMDKLSCNTPFVNTERRSGLALFGMSTIYKYPSRCSLWCPTYSLLLQTGIVTHQYLWIEIETEVPQINLLETGKLWCQWLLYVLWSGGGGEIRVTFLNIYPFYNLQPPPSHRY